MPGSSPRVIAVTGATGFTGPFVVRALAERFPSATLRCLVRPASNTAAIHGVVRDFVTGDLCDAASLDTLFAGADTVVHVASLGLEWTDIVIDALRRAGVSRGIFIGTTAMLTRLPVRSKPIRERAEALVRDSGLAWTILRPTMIYGTPDDRNIARLIRFVMRSPVIPVPAAAALQQPVHVADVAHAVSQALASSGTAGLAYNIAGATPLALRDLVQEVVDALDVKRLIVPMPAAAARVAVQLYAACVRNPRIKLEQIHRLEEDKSFDYSAAARDFGYRPRSFRDGVRDEVQQLRGAPSHARASAA
jgi:nucleoside-diphosphate-sugar epimerase